MIPSWKGNMDNDHILFAEDKENHSLYTNVCNIRVGEYVPQEQNKDKNYLNDYKKQQDQIHCNNNNNGSLNVMHNEEEDITLRLKKLVIKN